MQREVIFDEVFDAQKHFRVIMDCMARPGKIEQLLNINMEPPRGLNSSSAAVGFCLMDSNTSFHCAGENGEEISSYFMTNTDASRASLGGADFIFLEGIENNTVVLESKRGSLSYPDDSATIVISVEELSNLGLNESVWVILKGPGIKTESHLYIKGVSKELLKSVITANLEFPLGVDLILTDKKNRVCCIPRSSQINID